MVVIDVELCLLPRSTGHARLRRISSAALVIHVGSEYGRRRRIERTEV